MKYIYLAKAGKRNYKVGVAINVTKRIQSLQTSNPDLIEVVITRLVDDAYNVENSTHKFMHLSRTGGGKEWFELTPEQALDLAIHISRNPEIDITQQITVREILNKQNERQRLLDEKLDQIVADKILEKKLYKIPDVKDLPLLPKKEQVEHDYFTDDEFIDLAIETFISEGKVSVSLLQRKLRIGYGKASRIVETLTEQGIVSPWDGQRVRYLIKPKREIDPELAEVPQKLVTSQKQ
jgi:ribosomal protein S25